MFGKTRPKPRKLTCLPTIKKIDLCGRKSRKPDQRL